ncbi:hypothetical protein EMPS_00716 [Entomortierella parvispora]|uniref:G-patch domain-containing protein n=1 Tax=Entomortierella parvispora TaxID=205924 RepID=A0A9P3H1H5_9FUNG|nr:hypothetical protein EMPS_00716 [Entomortierella parvispora]
MADFDDDLESYIKARTVSEDKEKHAKLLASFAFPHPKEFHPTQDAPSFAQHPISQMWHDASTGTFSYYDEESSTYIPVEGPDSLHPRLVRQQQQQEQQQQQYQEQQQQLQQGYYTDPHTGYRIEIDYTRQGQLEAPPESDATLRLCVLSSDILPAGGVILIDASGVSFGRDRPLSGQGKRVRMVEMTISRFHASIYLDRQYHVLENPASQWQEQHQHRTSVPEQNQQQHVLEELSTSDVGSMSTKEVDMSRTPSSTSTPALSSTNTFGVGAKHLDGESEAANANSTSGTPQPPGFAEPSIPTRSEDNDTELAENKAPTTDLKEDDDHEEGEIEDSPSTGAAVQSPTPIDQVGEIEREESTDYQRKQKEREHQEQLYWRQMEEYEKSMAAVAQAAPIVHDVFQIVDSGSTHGTLLNGQRLSAAKMASQPYPLKHLDQLQLGSTVIEIHAHEEGRICARCQITDSNEIEVLDDKESSGPAGAAERVAAAAALLASKNATALRLDQKLTTEQERIEEMNRLKKKWAGPEKRSAGAGARKSGTAGYSQNSLAAGEEGGSSTYVDRAAKRRLYNPDHSQPMSSAQYNPVEVTEVATGFHVPVAKTNKGHAMLSKMGWKAGTGLGASGQGLVEPVQLKVSDKKAGLGSTSLQSQGEVAAGASSPSSRETQGEAARRRARERFAQLK